MKASARVLPLFLSAAVSAMLSGVPQAALAQESMPSYLQVRPVPHGTVQSHSYKSKSLGTERKVVVYTPPGYEKSTDRYAVLYLLHVILGRQSMLCRGAGPGRRARRCRRK